MSYPTYRVTRSSRPRPSRAAVCPTLRRRATTPYQYIALRFTYTTTVKYSMLNCLLYTNIRFFIINLLLYTEIIFLKYMFCFFVNVLPLPDFVWPRARRTLRTWHSRRGSSPPTTSTRSSQSSRSTGSGQG